MSIALDATRPQPAMEPWQAETLAYANSLPSLRPDPPIANGRYQLPDPHTGKPAKWTRASGFGKVLDDSYNLERWRQRKIIEGLLAHPELAAQIAAIPDRTTKDGKAQVHDLLDQAANLAGAKLAADLGTAFHTIAEHADLGNQVADGPWTPALTAYQQGFAREGMAVIPEAIELVVVNPEMGVAGRGDRFVTLDGRPHPVIADIKTGATLNEVSCAVQLSLYARSTHIWSPDGYKPMPPVDLDIGIIMHVDLEAGTCVMLVLDIAEGWERAKIAQAARKARNGAKGLLVPLTPAAPVAANGDGPKAVFLPGGPCPACGRPSEWPGKECAECHHERTTQEREERAAENVGASSAPTPAAPDQGGADPGERTAPPENVATPSGDQGEVATEVTQTTVATSPNLDRSIWITGRFQTFAQDAKCRTWVATNWPADIPQAPPWSDPHCDRLDTMVAHLEMLTGAPFPDPDPTQPTANDLIVAEATAAAEASVAAQVPDLAPIVDDGQPMTDQQAAAVVAATTDWPAERAQQAAAWANEAKRGARPFHLAPDQRTQRTGAILLAAVACLDHLWDDDPADLDQLVRAALTMAIGEDLQPAWPTGAVLGSLTLTQAQRLAEIAEAFASDDHTAAELGRLVLVPAV